MEERIKTVADTAATFLNYWFSGAPLCPITADLVKLHADLALERLKTLERYDSNRLSDILVLPPDAPEELTRAREDAIERWRSLEEYCKTPPAA